MDKTKGRIVSLEEHKEHGLTLRNITSKGFVTVGTLPNLTKRKLFNDKVIFSLARDGLTQACLKVLMQLYDCEEKTASVTRYPGDDYLYPLNCFSYCTHKMLVYQNRSSPYQVTEIKCRTTWLPAGNADWFKNHVTRSGSDDISETNAKQTVLYSELMSSTDLPADTTVRRQLQQDPKVYLIIK